MKTALPTYFQLVLDSFSGYGRYLLREVLHPNWGNYFYWLVAISLVFWLLELLRPWRREQGAFRQDFWLNVFYLFRPLSYRPASQVKAEQSAIVFDCSKNFPTIHQP